MADEEAAKENIAEKIEYELIVSGNTRNGDLLVDNQGYSYVKKSDSRRSKQYWKCCKKNQGCRGSVLEVKGEYVRTPFGTPFPHICEPDSAKSHYAKLRCRLLQEGRRRLDASALTLIDTEIFNDNAIAACIPCKSNLVSSVNYHRAAGRRRPLNKLKLIDSLIPARYLRRDVRAYDTRYLVFATGFQICALRSAEAWYIDAASKTVGDNPFAWSFAIHALFKNGPRAKKYIGFFILMSSITTGDYIKVFEAVNDIIDGPSPTRFTLSYDSAMWSAVKSVYSSASVNGCMYHYHQVIMKKCRGLDLSMTARSDDNSRHTVRRLLSLALLPAGDIASAFDLLAAGVHERDVQMLALMSYVRCRWISSGTFSVGEMSVRGRRRREGGYRARLAALSRDRPSMYKMIAFAYEEAGDAEREAGGVGGRKAVDTQNDDDEIDELFARYESKAITVDEYLLAVSYLITPADALVASENSDTESASD